MNRMAVNPVWETQDNVLAPKTLTAPTIERKKTYIHEMDFL